MKNYARNCKAVCFQGKDYASYSALCREYNIPRDLFSNRHKSGWSLEECLNIKERQLKHSNLCKGFIYKITNIKNNKVYVGLTTRSVKIRFKQHVNDALSYRSNSELAKDIRKYSETGFTYECIHNTDCRETLISKEIFYIKKFKSNIKGYNIRKGGEQGGIVGKEIEYKGELYNSIKSLCAALELNYTQVKTRLNRGWSTEDAVTNKSNKNSIVLNSKIVNYNRIRDLCKKHDIAYLNLDTVAKYNKITKAQAFLLAFYRKEALTRAVKIQVLFKSKENVISKIYSYSDKKLLSVSKQKTLRNLYKTTGDIVVANFKVPNKENVFVLNDKEVYDSFYRQTKLVGPDLCKSNDSKMLLFSTYYSPPKNRYRQANQAYWIKCLSE